MPIAVIIGTANRNIIVVPCIVKSWLYRSGPIERVLRPRELHAHQRRFDSAGDEHQKRGDDVPLADRLVSRPTVSQPQKPGGRATSHRARASRRRLAVRSAS